MKKLISAIALAAALISGCYNVVEKQVRRLEKKQVYVRRHHDAGSDTIVYLLPNTHLTSVFQNKADTFRKLGIPQIGVESVTEDTVDKEWVMQQYKNLIGEYVCHDISDYLRGGEKPKKIKTLDDYIRSHPLYSLALDPSIIVRGLDKKETSYFILQAKIIILTAEYYDFNKKIKKQVEGCKNFRQNYYKFLKDVNRITNEDKKEIKDLDEILKDITEDMAKGLETIKKECAEIKKEAEKRGYDWFVLPEPGSDDFTETLRKHMERVVVDVRSEDAAERIKEIGETAASYGEEHIRDIEAALQKAGISYITIGKKVDKSIITERLKEVLKDEELKSAIGLRIGSGLYDIEIKE